MDNFDVYEWNKNRYLKRIEESDDPKLGGELEAGVEGDRVEEGNGRRQATMKLDQLTFNVVKGMFEKIPMFGIAFPNANDSYRSVFNGNDLEDWKARIKEKYGNVNIRIDVEASSPWDRIQILDDKFRGDKKDYIKGKAAWLDKERQAGRSSGLDEKENDEFAGSDPKAGSTIQGTGFNWKPKAKK